jgi:hypothetical protein
MDGKIAVGLAQTLILLKLSCGKLSDVPWRWTDGCEMIPQAERESLPHEARDP